MLVRVLASGIRHRPGYLLTILVATAATTTAFAAAAGLATRLESAVEQSDALGVNILVRPQPGGPDGLLLGEAARIGALPGVAAVVPWVEYDESIVAGQPHPFVATTREALAVHRGWRLEGRWPGSGETVAGARAGVAGGATLDTPAGRRRVSGTLTTGEPIDNALLIDTATIAEHDALARSTLLARRFEVRADPRRVEEVASSIAHTVAGADARPLVRVTATRARLVQRLSWILAGAGTLTALLALGTLAAASLAQLHARRREIALFFALGYGRDWVSRLLLLELVAAGVVAWLLGAIAGEALAASFASHLLSSTESGTHAWGALAALLGAGVVLAVTARLTSRRLAALEPAALLAGR
jgi:predicted lysophospholipase L1 biosynthesis ABC-type transport system permease subunit